MLDVMIQFAWQVRFFVGGFLLLTQLACQAVSFVPKEPATPSWRVVSFIKESGLQDCSIFTFDVDRRTNTARSGTMWFATSDGLREYDGYRWTRHGRSAEGIPSDFVRCVLVTRAGELWVGSDRGAGIYDGKSYRSMGSETNLAGLGVRRISEDSDGTLWFCSDSWPDATRGGGITSYRQGQWTVYRTADGLPSDYVVNYFRDSAGRQWAVTLQGIAQLQGKRWQVALKPRAGDRGFGGGSFAESKESGLLFSSGHEVYAFRNGTWALQREGFAHQHGICSTADGKIFTCEAVGDGRKALAQWTPDGWRVVSDGFYAEHGYNEDVREGPDGNIWVMGYGMLTSWTRNGQWREYENIGAPLFVDRIGRVWFGSVRRNVFVPSPTVRYSGSGWETVGHYYRDLQVDSKGVVWGWTSNEVTRWEGEREAHFTSRETQLKTIFTGGVNWGGGLWLLGESESGAKAYAEHLGGVWKNRSIPAWEGELKQIQLSQVSTGGWFVVNSPSGASKSLVHVTAGSTETIAIPNNVFSEYYSGVHVSPANGELWLYGDNGLYRWEQQSASWRAITNTTARSVSSFVERGDEFWMVCNGATGGRSGLARFRRGELKTWPSRSLFNTALAGDGTITVGNWGGYQFVPNEPDAEPVFVSVPRSISVENVVKDLQGRYWAGNESVVFQFTPDGIPPQTRILSRNTNVLTGESFTIDVKALEKFRPQSVRDDNSFSWRVDKGPWSPFIQENSRVFDGRVLPVGLHRIEVRAREVGGDVDPDSAVVGIQILPRPIQDRAWFQWAVVGAILLLSCFAFIAGHAKSALAEHASRLEEKVIDRTAALEADIVRRRRIEEALRQSEERWNFALEGAGDGVWDWDVRTNKVFISRRWKSMLGYAEDEIQGSLSEWEKRVHPDDRVRVLDTLTAHLEGRSTVYISEHRLRNKQGDYVWILDRGKVMARDGEGNPIRVIGTHTDVTGRKNAEAIAMEMQGRFRQLAENIREVFWLTDITKTQVLYISPAFERIWGISCKAVQESPRLWLQSIHPEDRPRVEDRAHKRQATSDYDEEYRIVLPDGTIRWIHDRAFPVQDENGVIYRIAGIAEDITARRSLEAQFRQAQKMESLGTLSGGIAHDFNNILGAIFGNLHLLKLDLKSGDPALSSADEIERAANRAKSLVRQILAFSRQQPKARQVVSLAPVIDEVVSLLRASIPAGVELVKSCERGAPNVLADTSQIHQVLLNLCTNSWHALKGKTGRIEIRLEPYEVSRDTKPIPPRLHPGRYARLCVSDDGEGMDSGTLDRIFEPFFTTKPAGLGTGLGLSVVHGIVESHDGVIHVESELGKGTRFYIFLPAVEVEAPAEVSPAAPLICGHGQRILFLDDEAPLVDLSVRMLKRLGYQVEAFTHPNASLAAFCADPGRFDMVITDLHMPGMSGLEFAQGVRRLSSAIPIVLSSGFMSEDIVQKARTVGINQLLHKPSSLQDFSASIGGLFKSKQP